VSRSKLSPMKMSMLSPAPPPALIGPNVITKSCTAARAGCAWRCDETSSTMSSPASAVISIRRVCRPVKVGAGPTLLGV
jgi:hypothetical protein